MSRRNSVRALAAALTSGRNSVRALAAAVMSHRNSVRALAAAQMARRNLVQALATVHITRSNVARSLAAVHTSGRNVMRALPALRMSRRNSWTLAAVAIAAVTITMAGCLATAGPRADRAAANPPAAAYTVGSGRMSGSPTPRPSRPAGAHPSPLPSRHHAAPAPATITGASLGIAGAGTLKIPAWPDVSGLRFRGPFGSEGSTGTTSVALTFDDGPGPYTAQILDLLDRYHLKATFCLIGRQIPAYQSVVRRMIDDHMTLCNHSWDHDEKLGDHSAQYIAANLQRTIDAVHRIDPDATVAYFRNPGGNFTPLTVRVSELLGMRPLYWTEDTNDWRRPGVPAIEKTLTTQTRRSSIVLMHDAGGDRSETVAALTQLLPTLADRFHLIGLPTIRVDRVDPGHPAPQSSAPPPSPTDSVAASARE
jgi:peptidoglycan-N-acetylglucosamine deacetylase